jgi:hypothetical protein
MRKTGQRGQQKVHRARGLLAVAGICLLAWVSCDSNRQSGEAWTLPGAPGGDWKKVIAECISRVEQSDAVFYQRGERTTGKAVAQHMRENLRLILQYRSVPDPFGRNAGILLGMITTHEGYARHGITGRPEPFQVQVGDRRMLLYDWLKQELQLASLPGEEEGHEPLLQLYDAVLPSELLERWETYLDKCVEVTRRARGCKFHLGHKVFTSEEAAAVFDTNRVQALNQLREPNIKHPDEKDLYSVGSILLALARLPLPNPDDFSERSEYVEELDRHIRRSWRKFVEHNGARENVIDWLLREAGEPPPMPKLAARAKRSR